MKGTGSNEGLSIFKDQIANVNLQKQKYRRRREKRNLETIQGKKRKFIVFLTERGQIL